MGYLVGEFIEHCGAPLQLSLLAGKKGLDRKIEVPEAHRPGLFLAGYDRHHVKNRIIVFGKVEHSFLNDLGKTSRKKVLEALLQFPVPALILARSLSPSKELLAVAEEKGVALFSSTLFTAALMNKLAYFLGELFVETHTIHGTLVELFGIGVLLQGGSSVGKSEAALSLLERGHRLIADDAVSIKKKEGVSLEGECSLHTKHYIEIRGIGLINVANIYGLVSVGDKKAIELVVFMEPWNDNHGYDRLGLEEETCEIQGVQLPYYLLPVKPGRDIALLIETIVLNHRLKKMGKNYHPTKVFQDQLTQVIESEAKKNNQGQRQRRHPYKARS